MQKLCCVRTRQHHLPVWSHKFVLSSTTHISINSHPFLVGIVSIYGLVQAAQQYGKKFIKSMERFGFMLSKADPCFMHRKKEKGICMMSIYVDDNFLVGHNEVLDDAIDQIESTFNIKIPTEENNYLGCEFLVSVNNKKGGLDQPDMIKSLLKKFGYLTEKVWAPKTAGTPGFVTIKPQEEEKLDPEGQKIHLSGVGTLMYLLKHSQPDLTIPLHELLKLMDGANMAQYKEMLHVLKFVLEMKTYGLKFLPFNGKMW